MDFSTLIMSMYRDADGDEESDERVLQAAADQALLAGALGFHPWTTEHHFRGPWHSAPFQFASWIAPQLPEDRYFGFGVVSVPYHHPVRLVEQMNLLDQITKGRVLFGIGSGFPGIEPASAGLDSEYHRSGQAARDGLAVMERLWDYKANDDLYEFDTGQWRGRVVKRVVPSAYRHRRPTLIRTARTDAATIEAATHGWSIFLGTYGANLSTQLPLYRRTLEELRHPQHVIEDCLRWSTAQWVNVVVADNEADVSKLMSEARQERNAARTKDDHVTQDGLGGTPEMIAERLTELEALGVNHLLVRFLGEWHGDTQWISEQSMRLFAEQVMPRFVTPERGRLAEQAR